MNAEDVLGRLEKLYAELSKTASRLARAVTKTAGRLAIPLLFVVLALAIVLVLRAAIRAAARPLKEIAGTVLLYATFRQVVAVVSVAWPEVAISAMQLATATAGLVVLLRWLWRAWK